MIPRDDGPLIASGEITSVPIQGGVLPVMLHRAGEARGPTVILCPPGPLMGAFEPLEWMAVRLRAGGFHVVTMTYRQNSPEADVEDLTAVIDWLEIQDFADLGAIGVMGASRGGAVALRAAAADTRLRAVATLGAVTDLLQQVYGAAAFAPSRHRMLISWLGDPVANRAFYEKVQAISCADRITQPLLLMHGEHDMHSPMEQSIAVAEKARAGGNADVRLEIFPMMGHYGDVLPNGYAFNHLAGIFVPFMQEKLAP